MLKNLFPQFCAVYMSFAMTANASVSLFWTATDGAGASIVKADGNGANPTSLVSGSDNILGPNGLEHFSGFLYWTDQQLNAVKRVKLDGKGLSTVAEGQNPYDVFVDGTTVYWTSQERNYIDTILEDGSGYNRLFAAPTVIRPFAIAVTAEHIYWSQVGGQGSILRSDKNGANIVTIVPNAFVYDLQVTSDFLYFADNNFPGGIRRTKLDGSQGVTLVTGGALFHGLCVTDDAIYWAALMDGAGGGIRRANLDGSNPVNLYNSPPGTSVRGIVAISESNVAGPRFKAYGLDSKGLVLTLEVEPGKTYALETSGTLTGWKEAISFTPTSSEVTLTNPIPAGAQSVFVRARTP